MYKPDISIIIPVYNAEKYIEKCLDSICFQPYSKISFEIIAINDGSTDNSLKILEKYAQKIKNIYIVNQQNSGAGKARNIGIEKANGKYIWFVDSDDYISENAFEKLDKFIKNDYDFVVFNYNFLNIKNRLFSICNLPKQSKQTINYYFLNTNALYLWKHLYKAEIIKKNNINFINGIKNIEDFEFNIKFFLHIKSIYFLDAYLYNYFENSLSTSRNKSTENIIKIANDSKIVHFSLQKLVQEITNKTQKAIVRQLLNKSIIGFFYSLFIANYDLKIVNKFYQTYKIEKLLPAHIKNVNLKYFIFEKITNYETLYFILIKLYRKFRN